MASQTGDKQASPARPCAGGLTDPPYVPMIIYMGNPPIRGKRLLAPLTLLIALAAVIPAATSASVPLVDQAQSTVHGATSALPQPVQQTATSVLGPVDQ